MKLRHVSCIVLLAVLAGCQQAGPDTNPDQASDSIMVPTEKGTDFDSLPILISTELQKLGITIDEATQHDRQYQCLGKHVSGATVTVRAFRLAKGAVACRKGDAHLLIEVKGERETSDLLLHEIAYAINNAIRYDRILSL